MSQTDNSLIVQAPAFSPAQATTATALAAVTVLTTLLGLQLIRLFLPTLVFYLMDTAGLTIFPVTGIGAAVFLTAFLAAPLQRLLGLRRALALSVAGTALVRLAEQWVTAPPLDLALSIVGMILSLQFLPLGLGAARALRPSGVTAFGLAVLLGVAADSALHIAAGTYDLSWQNDLLPALVVLALVAATLVGLAAALRGLPADPGGVSWRRAWPLLAIGPWLVLQLIVFQNTARAAALTGWSLPAAGSLVTAGNLLGLAAAVRYGAGRPRRVALAAGVALALILAPASLPPWGMAVVILAGQMLAAMLWLRALGSSDGGSEAAGGLGRTTVAYGLSFLLFVLFFFAHAAPNNLALPYAPPAVLPVMALVVGLAAALAPAGESAIRLRLRLPLLIVGMVLFLAPAGLALAWQPPQLSAGPAAATLRIVDYNLHNGFNVEGRLDLEALAAVVEAANPDVVTLQEVSRGWVITGSADMLAWLANRLDMAYHAGPTTADGQWGNAILSRFPVLAVENGALFSEGQALGRGYVQAELDVGGATVRAISTHLYQYIDRPEDSLIRQRQVAELLTAWDHAPRTIIAGDFNAWPEHAEMTMLAAASFQDVAGLLAEGAAYSNPADAPAQRIDYIWLSPDLAAESFTMPQSVASDHLPLFAVVRFDGE